MADNNELGKILVSLGVDSAAFEAGLDRAAKQALASAKRLEGGFDSAGKSMGGSMLQARGSMMLMEGVLGVRLPRALNSLLASIGPIGGAFQMMLPIMGIAAAVAIVGKLIEKHEELVIATQKATVENVDLAIKENDTAKSMQLANLKLDDQIDKLEGRPTANKLKEALLEASMAVDKLAEHFQSVFQKMDEQIMKALGTWHQLWYGFSTGFDLIQVGKDLNETNSALKAVNAQYLQLAEQRRKYNETEPGSVAQKLALSELSQAYMLLGNETVAALDLVKKNMPGNVELINQLSQGATESANAFTDLAYEAENAAKKVTIANLEMYVPPKDFTANGPRLPDSLKVYADAMRRQEELENEHDRALETNPNKTFDNGIPETGAQIGTLTDVWKLYNETFRRTEESTNAWYEATMSKLQDLLAQGKITQQTFDISKSEADAVRAEKLMLDAKHAVQEGTATFQQSFSVAFDNVRRGGASLASSLGLSLGTMIDDINHGLAELIVTGKGLNFKQIAQKFEISMVQSVLQKAESGILNKFGVGKKDGQSAGGALYVQMAGEGGALGGFKLSGIPGLGFLSFLGLAGGGDVTPGQSYIVGEEGPELFTSGSRGSITSNAALRASGPQINYNIDARGADAGAEQRIRMALRDTENRAVARSVSTVNEMSKRH